MITKAITFQNLDGETVIENHMFGLTKSELAELELTSDGGMSKRLKAVAASNKGSEVFPMLKEILAMSYGRRSEDGKRFVKKPEYWQEFLETGAYDTLMMSLLTDPDEAASLMIGIVPADLQDKAKSGDELGVLPDGQPKHAATVVENQPPNQLKTLSDEEFRAYIGDRKPQDLNALELQELVARQLGTKPKDS